jgi:hypothetical protein
LILLKIIKMEKGCWAAIKNSPACPGCYEVNEMEALP